MFWFVINEVVSFLFGNRLPPIPNVENPSVIFLYPLIFIVEFILSCLMSGIISFINMLRNLGWIDGFISLWFHNWMISWAIAFPIVVTLLPFVRKFAGLLVDMRPPQ